MKYTFKSLPVKQLPKAPPLRKLIGPSFIILGLGLGSGEVILWPYLASNYGMGIIWGAVIGLTFQFFMNMEIERYALANGESIFVGFARKNRFLPFWFLLSTFLPWMWPGIAAASAALFSHVIGIKDSQYVAIGFLVLMGLILSLGPILYKTVENLQKVLIMVGVPSIFIISIFLAQPQDWAAAASGLIGRGEGFWVLPAGISLASFLAALAYAGAGGNLNLAQSYYVKEKGFGMGKYAGRITSLITGKTNEIVTLEGHRFNPTSENVTEFNKWWKRINIEHFLVFWLTGSITIVLLSLLAYTTVFKTGGSVANISFVINEAGAIGARLFPFVSTFFLLVVSLTLFGTQLTVFDAVSRIVSENIILAFPAFLRPKHIRWLYYLVLWAFIVAGILIFMSGFTQPLQLLTIAAVLNAFAMFVHTGLTLWLNKTVLPEPIRPNLFRTVAMSTAFLFYGGFSIFVIWSEYLSKVFQS
jgi:hypothetical protein